MKKKLHIFFFITLFTGNIFSLSAQTFPDERSEQADFFPRQGPHCFPPNDSMNYNGRKMPHHDGFFSVIGVKVDESADALVISVYFNDALDTNSIHGRQIFINEIPLPPQTEFLFNKSRRMMRFEITKTELFSLKIMGAKSFDGKMIRPTEIPNLSANTFLKYGRMEQKWQQF